MIQSNFKATALHFDEAINKLLLRKARGGRTSQAEASLQRRYEADMNREEGQMDLSMEDAMEEERDQLGAAVSWGNRRRRRFFKSIGKTFKKVGKFVGKTIKKAGGGILKGLAKLGAKLMKKMLPGLIKLAVKLCPKQYRPIIKKMVPHLLKGKIMKALMEGMPIIIKIVSKLVDKFFKPNSRAAIKYVVTKSLRIFANLDKAPGTTASKIAMVIVSKYKVLLLEPLATKLKFSGAIGIECMIRTFALHIVDPDYETTAYSNTCPALTMTQKGCNHLAKGPNCGDNLKWNGKRGDWGPLDMEIVRLSKGKPVCSFTYKADQHSCDHDWNLIGKIHGIKSSDPRRKKKDCCQPAVLSKPRTSSSKYNPLLQVKGHNCRLWYLGTMSLVQLVVSLVYQIHSGVENRDCLADGCSNMERCSRSTCQSSNAGHKCRWVTNPSKAKYPWITNTVGGTCVSRL